VITYIDGVGGHSYRQRDHGRGCFSIDHAAKSFNFAAGSEWLYSNTGFFLLSTIVQRVSGKTLRDFAAENIFAPLEMTHTQFRNSHSALIANRALAYEDKRTMPATRSMCPTSNNRGRRGAYFGGGFAEVGRKLLQSARGRQGVPREIQERGKLNGGKVRSMPKAFFLQDYRGLHT